MDGVPGFLATAVVGLVLGVALIVWAVLAVTVISALTAVSEGVRALRR